MREGKASLGCGSLLTPPEDPKWKMMAGGAARTGKDIIYGNLVLQHQQTQCSHPR